MIENRNIILKAKCHNRRANRIKAIELSKLTTLFLVFKFFYFLTVVYFYYNRTPSDTHKMFQNYHKTSKEKKKTNINQWNGSKISKNDLTWN